MTYTQALGSRFWFEFEKHTMYDDKFARLVTRAGAGAIQTVYASTRASGSYPHAFVGFVQPHRADWQTIADAHTTAVRDLLSDDWSALQSAFEDFGQGVLVDADPARAANNDSIHVMDVQGSGPPVGYHRWHGSLRALQLLGIGDSGWWERLDELVGLTWAIQSLARPKQGPTPNPPLPAADLAALRTAWLGMPPERRDRQYDLTGDLGYHPSPKTPAP